MEEWLNSPVGISVIVAIITGLAVVFRWSARVDTDRESFKEFMIKVGKKIEEIEEKINEIFNRLPPSAVSENSPLNLTDLGKRITEEIGERSWAMYTAERIKGSIGNKQPYEIQEFCKEFVKYRNKFTHEEHARIKDSAYKNGVKREQVLNVLIVELRDRLLEIQKAEGNAPSPLPPPPPPSRF